MTEAECLVAIADGADARRLLLDKMPSAARRFSAVDRSLRKLLADVRQSFPDAEYYTASGGFTLMLGKPHNDRGLRPQQQLIALVGYATIGDGDF